MKYELFNYFMVNLFAGMFLLSAIMTTSVLAGDSKLPDVDYLIRVARETQGWVKPPMAGPQVRYVIDHSTGKSYLVEVDYWGSARVLAEH